MARNVCAMDTRTCAMVLCVCAVTTQLGIIVINASLSTMTSHGHPGHPPHPISVNYVGVTIIQVHVRTTARLIADFVIIALTTLMDHNVTCVWTSSTIDLELVSVTLTHVLHVTVT